MTEKKKPQKNLPVAAQKKAATPQSVPSVAKPKTGATDLWGMAKGFFRDDPLPVSHLPDGDEAVTRHARLVQLVIWQSYGIIGLAVLMLLLFPVLRPSYTYYARKPAVVSDATAFLAGGGVSSIPKAGVMPLYPLAVPNVTKQALLSWAATTITGILTLGFAGVDKQILAQRRRFTSVGWASYLEAVERQNLRKEIKEKQLVLTTVPSDTPVILGEGIGTTGNYTWFVEMPVIMNFVTNNNVRRGQNAKIKLEVVRVDPQENPAGIAINTWVAR